MWRRVLKSWTPSSRRRPNRLGLTPLEDRLTPATFTVTSASGGTGPGTLNAAIVLLNASTDPTNTINFNLTFPATITLTQALPALGKPVTIQGPGPASDLTISGGGAFSIFDTQPADPGTAINFSKLTLTAGLGLNVDSTGGALTIGDETVTITNSIIAGNTADTGGGIHVNSVATVALIDSTVSGNQALTLAPFYGGGGIYFRTAGNLALTRTTISGNVAKSYGGGVLFYNGGGTINVTSSTLSGNSAQNGDGGAIYAFGISCDFLMTNSTVSGNAAKFSGGGLNFGGLDGTATIRNSTITSNTANATGSNSISVGGGVNFLDGTGTATFVSTILGGNENTSLTKKDLAGNGGVAITANFNAISDATGYTLEPGSGGNIFPSAAALNLGPLAFNGGGSTKTHLPGSGSVVLNAGSNPESLLQDQNGAPREQPSGTPDIGSVEVTPTGNPAALATFTTLDTASPYFNTPQYQFTVKYTAAGSDTINTASLGNTDISVTGPGSYSANATLLGFTDPNNNGTLIVATYGLAANPLGNPALWDVGDIGTYTAVMMANEVKSTAGLFVGAGALGSFKVVAPTTFTVTNANDTGAGSLRQALLNANANTPAADVIFCDPSFFTGSLKTITLASALPAIADGVTITGPGEKLAAISGNSTFRVLDTSSAPIGTPITITGLTLTAGSTSGHGGALLIGDEQVALTNVTVNASKADGHGGGISVGNFAKLTGTNLTVDGNHAIDGGGIAFEAGTPTLNLSSSTISGNTATLNGGGLYFINGGDVAIQNSTLQKNVSLGAGNGGGAVYFWGATNSFGISGSTISGNTANSAGGGILLIFTTGNFNIDTSTIANNGGTNGAGLAVSTTNGGTTVTLDRCTVSGNAGTNGGGLAVNSNNTSLNVNVLGSTFSGNSATVGGGLALNGTGNTGTTIIDVRNSTFSGNTATSTGAGFNLFGNTGTSAFNILNSTLTANSAGVAGGGFGQTGNTGVSTVTLVSTIVSGNTGGGSPDIFLDIATTLNVANSALGTATGYTINGTNSNNLSLANSAPAALLLGPLAPNGGPTATHALGANSKAINAGSNPAPAALYDQRGVGFARSSGTTDIGAFELQSAALTVTGVTVNGNPAFSNVSRSRILTIEVTFASAVTAANFTGLNAITLTRLASGVSSAGVVVATGVTTGPVGRIFVSQGGPNTLVLTFSNANGLPQTTGVEFGSLTDGRWELAIASAGYNSTTAGIHPAVLRRLFGDSQNDGTVDGSDLTAFGNVFNLNNALMDSNADGIVDGADLTAFGNRFSLTY